jgi:hypothetical protein
MEGIDNSSRVKLGPQLIVPFEVHFDLGSSYLESRAVERAHDLKELSPG